MFVTRRAAIDLPWEEPISLGPVLNTRLPNAGPTLSRSGHLMFFASVRSGSFDVFVTRRHNVHDDLAWETPVALPATINGPSFDVPSDYFENRDGNPQFYFASDRMTGGGANGLHIYVSEFRPDGTWSDPAFVAELNSPFVDDRPTIRADGLEVIFGSTREGNQDLYVARRRHVRDLWSTPENLGPVLNSPLGDIHPALSANGRTLYFASNRSGSFDLYASTRHRIRGN
jgi:Tol biopolymer transport system component